MAAAGRTFLKFLGRGEVVVAVTLGAVLRRRVRAGHHSVAEVDNPQEWNGNGRDGLSVGLAIAAAVGHASMMGNAGSYA